tara:strand:+ start:144 stop:341 length:198 start_codon:yes stop_codon:yes gene_type:complete
MEVKHNFKYHDYQLQKLSDADLKHIFIGVRGKINTRKRLRQDSKELEIYYCYIIREIEKRILFFM